MCCVLERKGEKRAALDAMRWVAFRRHRIVVTFRAALCIVDAELDEVKHNMRVPQSPFWQKKRTEVELILLS